MTPSIELPPRRRLARVLRALARQLPAQLPGLLEHPRFTQGREALGRLSSEAALESAVGACSPDEASELADRLLERWSYLGAVSLDPEAALVHPDETWIGDAPLKLSIELRVIDVDPTWEAVWDGATPTIEPGVAIATAAPLTSDAPASLSIRAHVRARTSAGSRVALVATGRIALRRPRVLVGDDRRRVIVTDQTGRPAVDVRVSIGDATYTTGPGGLLELSAPPASDLPIRVEGILAGRIP